MQRTIFVAIASSQRRTRSLDQGQRPHRKRKTVMTKPAYEIPNEMRDFAEKSVDQARKAFEGYMGAAQQAAGKMENAAQQAGSSAKDATSKAVSYASSNVNAAFELAQKLVSARDLQDIFKIQADFAKAQLAAMQTQAQDLAAMVQAAANTAKK